MTTFVKNIDSIFQDWSNIIDERHIGFLSCGTNNTIMAAKEQRPPFFPFKRTKNDQCRSLINCTYHNFRSIICSFCIVFFVCIKNKNMASANDTSDKKVLTMADVRQLAEDKDKCVMVIDNRVYDITKFIDEVCNYIVY
jgi:hypothetical protein